MDIEQFRKDYMSRKQETQLKQKGIAVAYQIDQAALSRFERGESSLNQKALFRLIDFVYPVFSKTQESGAAQ